jgi:putative nucleotidyltransferase with HDIG domain
LRIGPATREHEHDVDHRATRAERRTLLAPLARMNRLIPFAVGLAVGTLVVRARRAQRAAERFAAATLETLLNAVDANDAQTGAHVRRVAAYALALADAAGLSDAEKRTVERVALFHDIGKIHEALFDITHEEARLTPKARQAIATHPRRGAEVLEPLCAFYPELSEGVLAHHERWDGSGYPNKLKGRRIPLAARIVAIADTFDAITHRRRYREGRSIASAQDIIAAGRGTQFDPQLTDLFLLPPVLRDVSALTRELYRPRHRHRHDRRGGGRERAVPDVTFRWRLAEPAPSPPDRAQQRSPG